MAIIKNKTTEMKKVFGLLMISLFLVSCYKDDYIKDFEYDSIYFPFQTDVRTWVVGEGTKIEIGSSLGGVRENTRDRKVEFIIDNSLVTPELLVTMKLGSTYIQDAVASVTTLSPLPASYYTLNNSNAMVIKAGQHSGAVTLSIDSAKFLADAKTLNSSYVIPFYIKSADADTILESKRTAVVGIKYENMLFGNYWHGGVTTEKDASGNVIATTKYYTEIPSPDIKVWKLTTIAPNVLVTNGYSDMQTGKPEMKLTLEGSKIIVSSATGATFSVTPNGESNFNRAKLLQNRKIVLNYQYKNTAGNNCFAQDTLTFRNRIRDGVNEWQDENPANYK